MANPVVAVRDYFRHSVAELKKVTWPSKEMTMRWSLLVVVASAALAGFFAALDFGFQTGVNALFTNAPLPAAEAPATAPTPEVVPELIETGDGQTQSIQVESEPVSETPASSDGSISLPPINITN